MKTYFGVLSINIGDGDDVGEVLDRADTVGENFCDELLETFPYVIIHRVGSGCGFGNRDLEYELECKSEDIDGIQEIVEEYFDQGGFTPEVEYLSDEELNVSEGHTNNYYKITWDGGEAEYYYIGEGHKDNHLNTLDVGDGLEDIKGEYFDEFDCVNDCEIEEAIENYLNK